MRSRDTDNLQGAQALSLLHVRRARCDLQAPSLLYTDKPAADLQEPHSICPRARCQSSGALTPIPLQPETIFGLPDPPPGCARSTPRRGVRCLRRLGFTKKFHHKAVARRRRRASFAAASGAHLRDEATRDVFHDVRVAEGSRAARSDNAATVLSGAHSTLSLLYPASPLPIFEAGPGAR